MEYTIEIEREDDGRYLAEVLELPGVMAYGLTREEVVKKTIQLALRVIADQVEEAVTVQSGYSLNFAYA